MIRMVRDGIYYALALTAGAAVVAYVTRPLYALPLLIVALFCLYFFRDPDRGIPSGRVAVSPADGKVVAVISESAAITRVSIFLNIFDVHVNRTPISGKITSVSYHKGQFLVASKEEASSQNEQNTVTVEGDGTRVIFKQIAGLIARRIVCDLREGDAVHAGQRLGII
ncbi:MAG TPA: phosphatidylserine decarboxylase, partial [Terriglobales bacterium]|nr:phosphatidylserine decarboxylase [Terriglobales bacterium]